MIKIPGVLILLLIPITVFSQETDPFDYSPFATNGYSGLGSVYADSKDGVFVELSIVLYFTGGKKGYNELVSVNNTLRARLEELVSNMPAAGMTKTHIEKAVIKNFNKYLKTAKISSVSFSSFEISSSTTIPSIEEF
ncbi:MAG: hypothetical protein JW904_07095 [Spirochaetales bacterium]|nr:hypothetical protein [Spirochaetales bacterium]